MGSRNQIFFVTSPSTYTHSTMPSNNKANDLEETIKRIQTHKGVLGMMIVNNAGVAVRSNMDATITNQYSAVIARLSYQARSAIRDLEPTNDITFLRIRSKKNEVLLAPDKDFNLIVIQNPTTEYK